MAEACARGISSTRTISSSVAVFTLTLPYRHARYETTLAASSFVPGAPSASIAGTIACHCFAVRRWAIDVSRPWHPLHIATTASRPSPGGSSPLLAAPPAVTEAGGEAGAGGFPAPVRAGAAAPPADVIL